MIIKGIWYSGLLGQRKVKLGLYVDWWAGDHDVGAGWSVRLDLVGIRVGLVVYL